MCPMLMLKMLKFTLPERMRTEITRVVKMDGPFWPFATVYYFFVIFREMRQRKDLNSFFSIVKFTSKSSFKERCSSKCEFSRFNKCSSRIKDKRWYRFDEILHSEMLIPKDASQLHCCKYVLKRWSCAICRTGNSNVKSCWRIWARVERYPDWVGSHSQANVLHALTTCI